MFDCRSRDSDGSASRGSQEREYRRSDEKPSDRSGDRPEPREERRGGERNGEYEGPAGVQPDGLIEVITYCSNFIRSIINVFCICYFNEIFYKELLCNPIADDDIGSRLTWKYKKTFRRSFWVRLTRDLLSSGFNLD